MTEVAAVHPEPRTAPDFEQEALKHVWIHSAEWIRLAEERGFRVFERAYGSTLVDVYGREFIDGLSGLWVVNAGHGRKEIAEAMAEQASKLAYVSSANHTTVPTVRLAHELALRLPGDLNRVFFCSGGSEAVESAIKIAKQVQAMRGFPKRYKIIARRGSYHGMTYGAMSLTQSRNEKFFGPFMYGVYYVPSPNRYRNDFGLEGEEGDLMCANYVEQEILYQDPETVAAVIGEPISTSNGVHVPSPKYWQRLREICDKYGVLLIMDEVINGFGRTGKLFAAEHFGVVPDLMTMAKGITSGYAPMGAVAVRDSVFQIFQEQKEVPLGHLLTFGGHAVAAAAALKNLEIFEREGLVQQSAEKGAYLLERLKELLRHPTVGDVRGLGLMCGIELVKSKATKEKWPRNSAFIKALERRMNEKGLLTRVWEIVHVAPPLVVTYEELDRIVTIIDEALTETENEFASEIAE
ncbi:aspartate aminotransferase family protein [Thermomicrobium roseum]|jgi:adenosylmethionine-8-amino-7-oxononanoate aminotransferase|uniref:Taurine--pyruvate aminotransferase n=1 Tax=Thermomicrobium roseum (strain ATCC 27502 / DSM 5159 / P-2) TaxID=309801 RepID=B9L0N2_THERP|nr:aspartate aminotransferase family protein [Thermomicrobium roseum]ACM05004.1 taurine--pyruvate aminotransferase [Thermomicrobium roseum DSM 5159]